MSTIKNGRIKLPLLEVVDVVHGASRNMLRAVFYIDGGFNIYPNDGKMMKKMMGQYAANLVGVYDNSTSRDDLKNDLLYVIEQESHG